MEEYLEDGRGRRSLPDIEDIFFTVKGKEPIPSNREVTDRTPISAPKPRGQDPIRAREDRNGVIHGREELGVVKSELRIARLILC